MTTPLPAVYTPDTVAAHLGVSERNGAGTARGSRHTTDTGSSRDVRGDMEDGMTEDTRPAWKFTSLSEADFRALRDFGRIVSVTARWEYSSADTTREWLETQNDPGETLVMPASWQSVLNFVGYSSVLGLFGLTYEGERMRDALDAIDKWEAKNKQDRAEFERLKAKFGDAAAPTGVDTAMPERRGGE